ncbi:MAG TPA: membrane dipeptidase, partial [Pyrinomonadaceae bacterium]|nr:membrane dipeptidase [Pyrinomonadaceae bacterium]
MKKKVLIALALMLAAGVAAFFIVAPVALDRAYNTTHSPPPYAASERARALHQKLSVADLHADTLLWRRDPLARSTRGHADLPRLVEGGVSLQFFTVVTKSPRGLNYESNEEDAFDNITPLVVAQGWPAPTWTSLRERALHQARRLRDAAARSEGRLVVIRTSQDLARFVERRGAGETRNVAALLGLEGAHALEGDAAGALDALYDAGFRMVAPTHFFDNEWGGSAHGARKGGLT